MKEKVIQKEAHVGPSKKNSVCLDFRNFTKVSEIQPRKFRFQTHFEKSVRKPNVR